MYEYNPELINWNNIINHLNKAISAICDIPKLSDESYPDDLELDLALASSHHALLFVRAYIENKLKEEMKIK